MEGRTPVPERERLREMARHGCTMTLFLSTGLLEEVERELLAGGAYTPDTPAAIVYKATWPDEQVFRCTVGTLARTAREHQITRMALITVGACLEGAYERSKLYDPAFTHGEREGRPGFAHWWRLRPGEPHWENAWRTLWAERCMCLRAWRSPLECHPMIPWKLGLPVIGKPDGHWCL